MSTTRTARQRSRLSPEARRISILEAARTVAVERGLVAVTLKSVGAEAGVAASLVAHYFPVLSDLTTEVFSSLANDEIDTLIQLQQAEATETDRVRTLVDWLLSEERLVVTALWLDATLLGRRTESLAAEVRTTLERWQGLVADSMQRGVDSGEFVCSRPDVIAAFVLSLIDGLNANSLVGYRDSPGLEHFARELIERELTVPAGTFSRR